MAVGEGRHQHREQRDRGQEYDVDFGMTEDPEQMLPQERIPAPARIEEGPVEQPLHFEQYVAGDERRKGKEDHHRHDQYVPGI